MSRTTTVTLRTDKVLARINPIPDAPKVRTELQTRKVLIFTYRLLSILSARPSQVLAT